MRTITAILFGTSLAIASGVQAGPEADLNLDRIFEYTSYDIPAETFKALNLGAKVPLKKLIDRYQTFFTDESKNEIYIPIFNDPGSPKDVCSFIDPVYFKIPLSTPAAFTPVTPLTQSAKTLVKRENGRFLMLTRDSSNLFDIVTEFDPREKEKGTIILPFKEGQDICHTRNLFALPHGKTAYGMFDKTNQSWKWVVFGSDLKRLSEIPLPVLPYQDSLLEKLPEKQLYRIAMQYVLRALEAYEADDDLAAFVSTAKDLASTPYSPESLKGLLSYLIESGNRAIEPFLKNLKNNVPRPLDFLVSDLNDLLSDFYSVGGRSDRPFPFTTPRPKTEQLAALRERCRYLLTRLNHAHEQPMFFAQDGAGNFYVQSSLSPLTQVYDSQGQLQRVDANPDQAEFACFAEGPGNSSCAWLETGKRFFNELLTQALEEVGTSKPSSSFRFTWKERVDGMAVNRDGYLARTLVTESSGRFLEVFDPQGLLVQRIQIQPGLLLLLNSDVNARHFYFLSIIPADPKDPVHQFGITIHQASLRTFDRTELGRE